MRNFVTKMVMALTLAILPTVASAQWTQGITATQGGGTYWDNSSNDGNGCNVGYVLLGGGAGCGSQRPVGFLPIANGDQLLATDFRATNAGFSLFTNTATISLFGDVAGQNTNWGWFEGASFYNLNTPSVLPDTLIGNLSGWGLWMDLTNGTRALSTGNQFAFFLEDANEDGIVNDGAVRFGAEDILLADGDRDYNDVMGRLDFTGGNLEISTVPEPGTYALMASGLIGVFGFARRRKNALTA